MRVLLLTPIPHYLNSAIVAVGDSYDVSMEPPEALPEDVDFIVSLGYRHIIPDQIIQRHRGRLINIHISLLPWNRGADPNFWSWFDRTPKGVSIHAIDSGIDTGDVLAQLEVSNFQAGETLRTSHALLINKAADLFAIRWPRLRLCDWDPVPQAWSNRFGSYHKEKDKEQWMNKLPLGWDTPVWEVEELGSSSRNN